MSIIRLGYFILVVYICMLVFNMVAHSSFNQLFHIILAIGVVFVVWGFLMRNRP